MPSPANAQAAPKLKTDQDVERLFATSCGWCHSDGGRKDGKGPRLMGSARDDDYLVNRIATGKQGRMPAYGRTLDMEQIEAIVRYIRNLKPDGEGAS
jgi:mono/diheme cytochrome c family protein